MNHATLIVNRASCAVFHSLRHIVNIDVIAEHLPSVAVLGGHGRTCKPDEGRIWQSIADDTRVTDHNSGLCFTLRIFAHDDTLIHAVLTTVGFVCHNHNVAASRQRLLPFLELKHGGEDDTVGSSAVQQFLQMHLAFCLDGCLAQEGCALGKLGVKLIVEVDSVRHDHDGRAVQRLL